MNCKDLEDQISDYLEGRLKGEERRRLQEHLAVCARCAEKLEGLKTASTILRKLRRIRPSAGFDSILRWKIQIEGRKTEGSLERRAPILAIALTAIFLLFFTDMLRLEDFTTLQSSIESNEITHYVLEKIATSRLDEAKAIELHQVRKDTLQSNPEVRYVTF